MYLNINELRVLSVVNTLGNDNMTTPTKKVIEYG